MKNLRIDIVSMILIALLSVTTACQAQKSSVSDSDVKVEKKKKKKEKKVRLPEIDLSHWKVTLPVTNEKGKPYEI